ncbi:hypothetical protein PAPYR_8927 [Paratrimastix pyriformis]|uniref:Ankyrin repeat protein n=1 Tax=Paratrimastix pyriformis TaxID=342808 RepID=A0ABQ8UDS7_9EUKA|nr:hypothetical protein PAPYR_8927 [Paratrimastix pyriformis]
MDCAADNFGGLPYRQLIAAIKTGDPLQLRAIIIRLVFLDLFFGLVHLNDVVYSEPDVLNLVHPEHGALVHRCVNSGNLRMVEEVLRFKPRLDTLEGRGYTPLHLAAGAGAALMCKVLLQHGADPSHTNKDGMTALMTAAWFNRLDVLKVLLQGGADINQRDPTGTGAMHWAARQGCLICIKSVFPAHATAMPQQQNLPAKNKILIPEFGAITPGCYPLVPQRYMVQFPGVIVDLPDRYECTPCYFAARFQHFDCAEVLINYGADANKLTYRGRSAVDYLPAIAAVPRGTKLPGRGVLRSPPPPSARSRSNSRSPTPPPPPTTPPPPAPSPRGMPGVGGSSPDSPGPVPRLGGGGIGTPATPRGRAATRPPMSPGSYAAAHAGHQAQQQQQGAAAEDAFTRLASPGLPSPVSLTPRSPRHPPVTTTSGPRGYVPPGFLAHTGYVTPPVTHTPTAHGSITPPGSITPATITPTRCPGSMRRRSSGRSTLAISRRHLVITARVRPGSAGRGPRVPFPATATATATATTTHPGQPRVTFPATTIIITRGRPAC